MDTRTVQGVAIPDMMYGTAWKEDRTAELVMYALGAGFRAIDTANQRKHYNEAGVGEALRASGIARDDLFLQTKFTYQRGQDHRLPYDPSATLGAQVEQSFASSLDHLDIEHLDSYVLHGPWAARGWSAEDREVWAAMESLHRAGKTKLLGVSNISAEQLIALCDSEEIQPAFVQNRCYARKGWDRQVRAICAERDIVYQGFSLLTANCDELATPTITSLAAAKGATVPQLVFRFAQLAGMLPLTGTSSEKHMIEDLECGHLELSQDDLATIDSISG